jgi:hypothetical protein
MAVGQAIYELVKNRHKPPKQDFATYKLNGRHAAKQPPTNEIQKTAFESLVKQSPKPVVIEMPKFGEYVGVQLSLFDS